MFSCLEVLRLNILGKCPATELDPSHLVYEFKTLRYVVFVCWFNLSFLRQGLTCS